MKIVILYSGGLDSFILYHWGKYMYSEYDFQCIYYKYGADSEQSEIANLPDFVEIRKIDWLDINHTALAKKSDPFAGNIYIPGRNLILISLAACQELPDEIWMGTLYDEDNTGATDKNSHFRLQLENLLNYTLSPFLYKPLSIRFPFVEQEFNKLRAIEWVKNIGKIEDHDIIKQISCWNHTGINCGICKQCFKRELVFAILNIKDSYKEYPLTSEYGLTMIDEYKQIVESGNSNLDEQNVYNMLKQLDLI